MRDEQTVPQRPRSSAGKGAQEVGGGRSFKCGFLKQVEGGWRVGAALPFSDLKDTETRGSDGQERTQICLKT